MSTQLPYALTAAAVFAVGYVAAGVVGYSTESSAALVALPITLALMAVVIIVLKKGKKA